MPSQSREAQVSLDVTEYYHCISRCVRRAFLCGEDHYTGKNYDHRKQWIQARLAEVSAAFAIEVCSYAIMCNHSHLVLWVARSRCAAWSSAEVASRYAKLFPNVVEKARQLSKPAFEELTKIWRQRLSSISWFMRAVNEPIARRANAEDGVTGRFWEGRFKSIPILDDAGLLTCMTYVDLNPFRAGQAKTASDSEFTSIEQRLRNRRNRRNRKAVKKSNRTPKKRKGHVPLAPMRPKSRRTKSKKRTLPFHLDDYLRFLNWTKSKRESPSPYPLGKRGISPSAFRKSVAEKPPNFGGAAGSKESLKQEALRRGCRWLKPAFRLE